MGQNENVVMIHESGPATKKKMHDVALLIFKPKWFIFISELPESQLDSLRFSDY